MNESRKRGRVWEKKGEAKREKGELKKENDMDKEKKCERVSEWVSGWMKRK